MKNKLNLIPVLECDDWDGAHTCYNVDGLKVWLTLDVNNFWNVEQLEDGEYTTLKRFRRFESAKAWVNKNIEGSGTYEGSI